MESSGIPNVLYTVVLSLFFYSCCTVLGFKAPFKKSHFFKCIISQYCSVPVLVNNLGLLEEQDYWRLSASCSSVNYNHAVRKHRYYYWASALGTIDFEKCNMCVCLVPVWLVLHFLPCVDLNSSPPMDLCMRWMRLMTWTTPCRVNWR